MRGIQGLSESPKLCGKYVYISGFSEGKIHSFYQILQLSLTRMYRDACKRVDFLIGMGKCAKRKDLEKKSKENKTIH